MDRIYLDWAATAPPAPAALARFDETARLMYGNPSSLHREGKAAMAALEASRADVARAIGCDASQVSFTAGGTEANNIVLTAFLRTAPRGNAVISAIEHASVYEPSLELARHGIDVRFVPARPDGVVDARDIEQRIDADTRLVSIMHVNNETGAIQPIAEIARRSRQRKTALSRGESLHVHCDCVQSLGKVPVDCRLLDFDSASFSGHKLGGPRGCGVLYLRRSIETLFRGGGQEGGVRPGTENLAAIRATALAIVEATNALSGRAAAARKIMERLITGIADIHGAVMLPEGRRPDDDRFSPYILSVSFPPLPSEVLTRILDDQGIAVSAGSACSSRERKARRVLEGSQISVEAAASAIRISIGPETGISDVDRLLSVLNKEVALWSRPLRV